jgi:hypothetical protein
MPGLIAINAAALKVVVARCIGRVRAGAGTLAAEPAVQDFF